jgi:hypothetical protein
MTKQVTLQLDGVTVDLSSLGVQVTHRLSNPIIVLDTPRMDLNTSNSVGINIGFITEAMDLRFTLTDGLGSLDYAAPTTNYEKLFNMAYKRNPKILTIDGKTMPVHIENISLPWAAGQKDLSIDGTLSLRIVMNINMEDSGIIGGSTYAAVFTNGSPSIQMVFSDVYLTKGNQVTFAGGTLPSGFVAGTKYWVILTTASTFMVSATKAGDPISAGSAGTGSHTVALA